MLEAEHLQHPVNRDNTVFLWLKDRAFSFQNKSKNLDPSLKHMSRFLGLFRKNKIIIIAKFHMTICSHLREWKTLSYSQINMEQC